MEKLKKDKPVQSGPLFIPVLRRTRDKLLKNTINISYFHVLTPYREFCGMNDDHIKD